MNERHALVRLHRLLIAAGIALSIVFGVYQVKQLTAGADGALPWLVVSGVMGAALTAYLVWFNKKIKKEKS
ncbi:MAG: hypothetical protein RMA76_15975 [Deltaproteobacteria bacterium]|jgi:Flp pilus assembly protein protease CpaA